MTNTDPILTIAIPTYNMAWCLEKNLRTYCAQELSGRLEVIVLNNHSSDNSNQIAQQFCQDWPDIFKLCDRDNCGYGSSINEALQMAGGRYFRIVDADDWVDTETLVQWLKKLENCEVDVVQTDYTIVDMQSGNQTPVLAGDAGCPYDMVCWDFQYALQSMPSIHSTTYRKAFLRDSGFEMQDKTFFVDEEYIVLPYLHAKNLIYYSDNIYRYQVANPEQSTSPKNRGIYAEHRERVIRRLISAYQQAEKSGQSYAPNALSYCRKRIQNAVADHFTTLLIYMDDRAAGRKAAAEWQQMIRENAPEFLCRQKYRILQLLNFLKITPQRYLVLKRLFAGFLSAVR